VGTGDPPRIYSPQPGAVFSLRRGTAPEDQKILLLASANSGIRTVAWLVDGRLVFRGPPSTRVFILPQPGIHTAVCIDDTGRSAHTRFKVM
jgi:membrane carboxypeptidase/penicillin-binding protein PbpC